MNKKRIVVTVLLLLLLLGGVVVWQKRPQPTTLSLNLTGTPGLKVGGTLVVDGSPSQFNGTLPATITVVVRTFDYTIQMQEPKGELRGELKVGNDIYGRSSIASDLGGVRGGYEHTWRGKGGGVMTTVDKGDRP
jgi:hypothetical protein